jgi:hypothetical protein
LKEVEVLLEVYYFYCNMSCALHHSFCIGSYVVYLRSWSYRYIILDVAPYLVEYVARRHIALHSYAFVEALADVVCEEKWLYTTWWGCSRGDDIWYINSWILYSEVFLLLIEIPFKLLINSTCGLNSLLKQFTCWVVLSHPCITQCRYSILVMGIGK